MGVHNQNDGMHFQSVNKSFQLPLHNPILFKTPIFRSMNDTLLTILKVLATLGSAYIIVSPIPSMRRVYQAHDTGEMQLLPLVGMLINYHIM